MFPDKALPRLAGQFELNDFTIAHGLLLGDGPRGGGFWAGQIGGQILRNVDLGEGWAVKKAGGSQRDEFFHERCTFYHICGKGQLGGAASRGKSERHEGFYCSPVGVPGSLVHNSC